MAFEKEKIKTEQKKVLKKEINTTLSATIVPAMNCYLERTWLFMIIPNQINVI